MKYTFAEGEKKVLVINRCKPTLKIKYTFAEGENGIQVINSGKPTMKNAIIRCLHSSILL